jgi:hypothetical protein
MTPEQRAKALLDALTGAVTCMGYSGGPENDTNRWQPAHRQGKSYTLILEAIRAAVMDEREECARIAETASYNRHVGPKYGIGLFIRTRPLPPPP